MKLIIILILNFVSALVNTFIVLALPETHFLNLLAAVINWSVVLVVLLHSKVTL